MAKQLHSNLKTPIKNIAVIGLGLIGGSLSKAFSCNGIKLNGYDISKSALESAIVSDIFDLVTDDIDVLLGYEYDLIYLALPISETLKMLQILSSKGVTTLITDAASTKGSICDLAIKLDLNFIGGHPIAGKESSGFDNSDKNILINAKHIMIESKDLDNLKHLIDLHTSIGMNVDVMTSDLHDKILADISHIPHVIAFSLIDFIREHNNDSFAYVGGGFKDFTRIAASDPVMWRDILLNNKEDIIESLDLLQTVISKWREMIDKDDSKSIEKSIEEIRNIRSSLN